MLYVIISSFFVFPVCKALTNNVFRPSSPYSHAVDRWSIPLAISQSCKWSLCSSAQNMIFDEENKELDQKDTMEEETENMVINMFHSVLCGASHTHATSDYAIKEIRTDTKIPIVLLHGLLGSARNFQSWMKLVQQKEIEIERDEHLILQVDETLCLATASCMNIFTSVQGAYVPSLGTLTEQTSYSCYSSVAA